MQTEMDLVEIRAFSRNVLRYLFGSVSKKSHEMALASCPT